VDAKDAWRPSKELCALGASCMLGVYPAFAFAGLQCVYGSMRYGGARDSVTVVIPQSQRRWERWVVGVQTMRIESAYRCDWYYRFVGCWKGKTSGMRPVRCGWTSLIRVQAELNAFGRQIAGAIALQVTLIRGCLRHSDPIHHHAQICRVFSPTQAYGLRCPT